MFREDHLTAALPPSIDPECWVEAHGDCLFRYAVQRVHRPEVAEDLVQETFLAAVRTRERFAGRSSERSWLVGILKNKLCDYFRKLGRETTFTDLESPGDANTETHAHRRAAEAWMPEGETTLRRAEFMDALRTSIARLPERTAQVFMLREVHELPSREICERLSITEANLWVMLHRARLALRQDLEASYFEHEEGRRP